MGFKDLRDWIEILEVEGECKRIEAEVDWELEIGAIVRRVSGQEGPALLFENIKGYKNTICNRLFTNGLGSQRRLEMSLGLPKNTPYREIVRIMKERFTKPVGNVIVESGPVKENIIKGNEVDLYQFPVPKWHHLDGGRYFNTFCGVVTRDPETGELNVGLYRGMLGSKSTIPVLLAASQHWGVHYTKYRERGESMPVAVIYGWDPTLFINASTPHQHRGYSEYELTGALRREPVQLVKCETSDLLVPASAEIALEGSISPDPATFEMEGPFGEYPGYYGGMRSPKPRIKVECITYRDDPIFMGSLEGTSPHKWAESAYYGIAGFSAVAWDFLDRVGVPGVMGVWASPVTATTHMRVQIHKMYRGHAKQVANALWSSSLCNYAAKHLIVVDEDIDIFDDEALEWAIAYRVNAAMDDVVFFPGTVGSMLDPSIPLEQRNVLKYGQGKWTRMLIDATKNWELERQEQYGGEIYPPLATDINPEMEELIARRWKEYGLDS
jgi:UbiD family decarboxylase